MSIILYTTYLKENALFLQNCILKNFKYAEINPFLKEQLYIIKYIEYLSFSHSDISEFHNLDFIEEIMKLHSQIFFSFDNQYVHESTKTSDIQKNIRELIDDVIYKKFFSPISKNNSKR